jgi:hypothetical protein
LLAIALKWQKTYPKLVFYVLHNTRYNLRTFAFRKVHKNKVTGDKERKNVKTINLTAFPDAICNEITVLPEKWGTCFIIDGTASSVTKTLFLC